jgi:hypothetical protein
MPNRATESTAVIHVQKDSGTRPQGPNCGMLAAAALQTRSDARAPWPAAQALAVQAGGAGRIAAAGGGPPLVALAAGAPLPLRCAAAGALANLLAACPAALQVGL